MELHHEIDKWKYDIECDNSLQRRRSLYLTLCKLHEKYYKLHCENNPFTQFRGGGCASRPAPKHCRDRCSPPRCMSGVQINK